MEQQLRAWLRYSIVFGLYTQSCEEHTTNKIEYCSPSSPAARQNKRPAWCVSIKINCHQRLKNAYLYALLPWICALYVNGLVWRRPIPGTMLSWLVATLFFTSQTLSTLLIAAEGIWRQQEHEEFLRLLQEIELSLKLRLKQDIKLDWLAQYVRFLLKYLLSISFICYGLFIYNFAPLQYVGYFWNSIWFALTMRFRLLQLMIYVRVLQHYMECLCVKVRQVVAYRTAPSQQLMDIDYAKLQSLECLLAIKEIYSLLFRGFQLLINFAGWSLFSIITSYMLDYGCTLYWAMLSWEGYLERRNYYIACFWWLLPMTAIIWHLCSWCDNCIKLDRSLAALMTKIIISRFSKSLRSYRLLVHQFSTQLQLQRIEVTATNFFTLDLRLIMSIGIAIATYLVIVIQFLSI
ncbi:PREDICTED: putative gustatory receptor 39b [Rhagoletis zephyria]|uniref:putative gustatory receptor 39b n=1 Tax=Rhagoletis zephyria TaxID=28612 RepID=UPI00081177D8|nr:PREDICTED: putative gustatory receptor 39b [Rhagoletis zephyria]